MTGSWVQQIIGNVFWHESSPLGAKLMVVLQVPSICTIPICNRQAQKVKVAEPHKALYMCITRVLLQCQNTHRWSCTAGALLPSNKRPRNSDLNQAPLLSHVSPVWLEVSQQER